MTPPTDPGGFTRIGPSRGSNQGGLYEHDNGSRWYLKHPASERQAVNEVLASGFYRAMGFDAVEYHVLDNGMVASRWRPDLPEQSQAQDLRNSRVMQEAFLPSALIANWDVVGLVYDNAIYDPATMDEPVFLDFGGAFDTRAQGGHKDYATHRVPALDGFTDPSINQSAATVFQGMTPSLFAASRERLRSLGGVDNGIPDGAEPADPDGFRRSVNDRMDILLDTEYEEVF